MWRSDIYIFVAAFSAQKLESAHFSLRITMVRCFLTACFLPCFSSSALIGPNRVVSGQSRLLPDGGESLSSKNSFPTNASGRPVPTGLVPTGLDNFTSPLHCTPRAHARLFAFACFASCSHCDRIGDCKVFAMLPCVVFLALLRLFCCQVRAVVAPSRAYACLIACLFASTCMHCDCVEVDACLNLVCSVVCGDVRCPGSCLALVLCFALLALFALLRCSHCTSFAPFCLLLGSRGACFNPGEQPGEKHNFEIHF